MKSELCMRVNLSLNIVFAIVVGLFSQIGFCGTYGGGSGTTDEPFVISTAEHMQEIGTNEGDWDKHFVLMADIDLSGYTGISFNIIGNLESPFTGVFDGHGHIISNLTINTSGADSHYLGLFGYIGSQGSIQNLGIEQVNIVGGEGSYYIGALCGYTGGYPDTIIRNCYSTGTIAGHRSIGGLCGEHLSGVLINCWSSVTISGNDYSSSLGGLCGYSRNSLISNCYATGAIYGANSGSIGGLCGGRGYSTISNCFCDVEASGIIGGVGGIYADSTGVIGKTTTQMQTLSTFTEAGWDFAVETSNGTNQIWQIPAREGYPLLSNLNGYIPVPLNGDGTEASPYLITNASDLGAIYHYNSNAYFRLEENIDLAGIQWSSAVIPFFSGHFDGNGNVISRLNIQGYSYLGLFGIISGSKSKVNDLGLVDVSIFSLGRSRCFGSICGYNTTGSISNCYATGSMGGNHSSAHGGICGHNAEGSISNCYATVSVSGKFPEALGGVCGINRGTISSCWSSGSISCGNGVSYLGGLCGFNSEGNISDCYATGSVTGGDKSYYIGGLCGYNNDGGIISSSKSSGAVTGYNFVGGFSGTNRDATIGDCNATGNVTGNDYVGGLCGKNVNGIILNCFTKGNSTGNDYLGGLCGLNEKGTIKYSYVEGHVIAPIGSVGSAYTGSYYVGGLCGLNNNGSISDSYVMGAVMGSPGSAYQSGTDYVGGLCGYNYQGSIFNCLSTGKVSGRDYLGGLCGYNNDAIFSNCVWDVNTTEMNAGYNLDPDFPGTITNVIGKTTAEMQSLGTFVEAGWDFVGEDGNGTEDVWKMRASAYYPILAWQEDLGIAGDVLFDNFVDWADVAVLAGQWGSSEGAAGWKPMCDVDGDGSVDIGDVVMLAENWLCE